MIINNIIYIRSELNKNECRTPIIPTDIQILIEHGFKIYIESSNNRIFSDEEYENNGAIITLMKWYDSLFSNALIIGLKELDNFDKLNLHKHLFFSHSYKNQINSKNILSAFYKSNSIIYDFEYFINKSKKRLISFGFYAGLIGCALGILQYLKKDNINDLKIWKSEKDLIDDITKYDLSIFDKDDIKIGIIGANGNCGNGVKYLLNKLYIKHTIIDRNNDKKLFSKYNIFYNCILLNPLSNDIFFDEKTIFDNRLIIVDISCDNYINNNPIKLYKNNTTWNSPVYKYNDKVDIISIENLPSLLPYDSSKYFSKLCCQLLLQYNDDKNNYWNNLKKIYYENVLSIL